MVGIAGLPLGLSRQSDLTAILAMFASGEQGVWFDRQDLSSMYQDAAGTTACAVGSPVGLALDKSKGLALGAELVTVQADRDFSADTGFWVKGVGWAIGSGSANATASSTGLNATVGIIGHLYEVTYTVSNFGGGTVVGRAGGNNAGTQRAANGTFTDRVLCGTASTAVGVFGTNFTGSIDNISIKEVLGNHATQGTSASRPILTQDAAGRYHAPWDGLDDSMTCASGGGATAGFFFCAAITVSGGAATARTLWSDVGANTGYRVRVNASNQLELAAGNGVAFTSVATVATLPVGETHVVTAWDDGTNLNVQIDSGAVASVARPVVSAGTAGITIAKDNGAATSFFNGRDYGMVYRTGTAPTATELARTKRFLGARAGVSV